MYEEQRQLEIYRIAHEDDDDSGYVDNALEEMTDTLDALTTQITPAGQEDGYFQYKLDFYRDAINSAKNSIVKNSGYVSDLENQLQDFVDSNRQKGFITN